VTAYTIAELLFCIELLLMRSRTPLENSTGSLFFRVEGRNYVQVDFVFLLCPIHDELEMCLRDPKDVVRKRRIFHFTRRLLSSKKSLGAKLDDDWKRRFNFQLRTLQEDLEYVSMVLSDSLNGEVMQKMLKRFERQKIMISNTNYVMICTHSLFHLRFGLFVFCVGKERLEVRVMKSWKSVMQWS